MKRVWLLAAGLALTLGILLVGGCNQAPSVGRLLSTQQEGIWVSGTGKVSAVPDIAILQLGIEAKAASVAEAQRSAIEAMNRVMKALTDNGVAKKDIQTQQFSIQPMVRWDKDREQEIVTGYRVVNRVSAKIREIDKAGTVIDAVAASGGDLSRIDSIAFSVDDPSAYYVEARKKAMTDAAAKAKQLADLAGVRLGKPSYITESMFVAPPVPFKFAEAASAMAETPISPGETDINLTVQVVYGILK